MLNTRNTTSMALNPTGERIYPDYAHMSKTDHAIAATQTIVALFKEVSSLVPNAGPLQQVLGITGQLITIISDLRDLKDECENLIRRILGVVKVLVEDVSRLNAPMLHGTPTAARVYTLAMNIKAIKDDVERWKNKNLWDRLTHRAALKTAIIRHEKNLGDCFNALIMGAIIHLTTAADLAAQKSSVGSSEASRQARVGTLAITSAPDQDSDITMSSTQPQPESPISVRRILRESPGQTMFQQLNQAVRNNSSPSSSSSRFPARSNSDSSTSESVANCSPSAWSMSSTKAVYDFQLFSQDSSRFASPGSTAAGVPSPPDAEDPRPVTPPFFSGLDFDIEHQPQSEPEPPLFDGTALKTLDLLNALQNSTESVSEEAFAEKMADLSLNLHELGMQEDALAIQTFCVGIYRELARNDGLKTLLLITSLDHLSNYLAELGHWDQALDSAEEAVRLCRQHLPSGSADDNLCLPRCLNNLSLRLSDVGRPRDALVAIQEAVSLRESLGDDAPEMVLRDSAAALGNLSRCFSSLGIRDKALDAAQNAVEIHLRFVEKYPDTYNADLATGLCDLSKCLLDAGDRQKALYAAQEAIDLHEQLAIECPEVFDLQYADALTHLSNCFSDLGDRESALAAMRDAADRYRRLATFRPAVHNSHLARSLGHMSGLLAQTGKHEEALSAIQEAVDLHRTLAAQRPYAFKPDLAVSLQKLSLRLSDLNRHMEALEVISEAKDISRELSAKFPSTFDAQTASTYLTLSNCHSRLGNREAALDALKEAVVLHNRLARENPSSYGSRFVTSLVMLSEMLSTAGHKAEALDHTQDAVDFLRPLIIEQPLKFKPSLAYMLSKHCRCLLSVGRKDQALAAITESVALYRDINNNNNNSNEQPTSPSQFQFTADYAQSLTALCNCLWDARRPGEALTAIEESTEMYRQLALKSPSSASCKSNLARSLYDLSFRLQGLERWVEALACIQEAAALYRELVQGNSQAAARYQQKLGMCLKALVVCLQKVGRVEEVQAVVRERALLSAVE